AAPRWLQVEPANLTADIGLARDLAERDFTAAHPGIGLKVFDRNRGRGGGPDCPRGRRRPGLPEDRQGYGHLAFETQRCNAADCMFRRCRSAVGISFRDHWFRPLLVFMANASSRSSR